MPLPLPSGADLHQPQVEISEAHLCSDTSTPPAPTLLLAPTSVYIFLSSFFLSLQGILTIYLLFWGRSVGAFWSSPPAALCHLSLVYLTFDGWGLYLSLMHIHQQSKVCCTTTRCKGKEW